jgi:hypothetical protein
MIRMKLDVRQVSAIVEATPLVKISIDINVLHVQGSLSLLASQSHRTCEQFVGEQHSKPIGHLYFEFEVYYDEFVRSGHQDMSGEV